MDFSDKWITLASGFLSQVDYTCKWIPLTSDKWIPLTSDKWIPLTSGLLLQVDSTNNGFTDINSSDFTHFYILKNVFLALNPPCTRGVFHDKKYATQPKVLSDLVIMYLGG